MTLPPILVMADCHLCCVNAKANGGPKCGVCDGEHDDGKHKPKNPSKPKKEAA